MFDEKGFNPKYDDCKITNQLIIGNKKDNFDGSSYRKVELILNQDSYSEKSNTKDSQPLECNIKDRVILHSTKGGQIKIECWLINDKGMKYFNGLHISKRTSKGVYGSNEVTLNLDSTIMLKKYLDRLISVDFANNNKYSIPMDQSKQEPQYGIISKEEFEQLIQKNIDSVDTLYKVLAIKKMKKAIEKLDRIINGEYKNEIDIQEFLKKNIWMFGNEYCFIVQQEKINTKNILDLVPKNFENYIDIIEVKLPNEKLFNFDQSHQNYYSSSKLTKAIAQTQNYIFELENAAIDSNYQQENNCKIIRPKGIIIFGSEKNLADDEKKYLRILNSSYHNVEILTYQQLLEKANNTINFLEKY